MTNKTNGSLGRKGEPVKEETMAEFKPGNQSKPYDTDVWNRQESLAEEKKPGDEPIAQAKPEANQEKANDADVCGCIANVESNRREHGEASKHHNNVADDSNAGVLLAMSWVGAGLIAYSRYRRSRARQSLPYR